MISFLLKPSYFHSVNISTILRCITEKKLHIWDKTCIIRIWESEQKSWIKLGICLVYFIFRFKIIDMENLSRDFFAPRGNNFLVENFLMKVCHFIREDTHKKKKCGQTTKVLPPTLPPNGLVVRATFSLNGQGG